MKGNPLCGKMDFVTLQSICDALDVMKTAVDLIVGTTGRDTEPCMPLSELTKKSRSTQTTPVQSTVSLVSQPTVDIRQLMDESTQFSFGCMDNIYDGLIKTSSA